MDCQLTNQSLIGSNNDGNMTRYFFTDSELSTNITVNIDIIRQFKTVLHPEPNIDVGKYHVYTLNTAKLFTEKYLWYSMPPQLCTKF